MGKDHQRRTEERGPEESFGTPQHYPTGEIKEDWGGGGKEEKQHFVVF